jgi:conjugative relaxase-like TrwC/TraI family protein
MKPIASVDRAVLYFGKSDGGYYLVGGDLHREWGGRGAERLRLSGEPRLEQFKRLLHGLDPHTGKQLTAQLVEDRIPAWDLTGSVPKGVTTAYERGDARIRDVLWEAARETMADIEQHATTRVRKGGQDADRVTGNLVWLAVEHAETRPTREDGMPDWDRHLHFVVANVTWDPVEEQWKAVKMRPVFDLKKYFDRSFDLRLSSKLAALGYEIETKLTSDGRGGKKYFTWDIKGIPESVTDKFSRRTKEVDEAEARIVAEMKERDADAPDHLSAVARDKLGASSRLAKREDMTLDDYREYWHSRITAEEGLAIGETIKRALLGLNAKPEPQVENSMAYAVAHTFQRNSVVDWHDLAVAAMERSMGAAWPEEFEAEARRQGVLFKDGQCTTREVLEQEQRIVAFARQGRATFTPLAAGKTDGLDGLSAEQKAAVRHIRDSTDQVLLIRGGAGTGKTTMMKPALERLDVPAVLLAPSADASRGTLRESGFKDANTVASFLGDEAMQASVQGGGIIYVDEAGLLAIDDLERLCAVADKHDARIVLQGDPSQHEAVDRHGNMLSVLERFGSLPVARLTTIQRQKGDYAQAVAAVRDGEFAKADQGLRKLGWVVEGEGHAALAAEYSQAIEERKAGGERKTVIVIDPTHQDGDRLTEALRDVRKAKGLIVGEEKTFTRLVPLHFTDAQKGDAKQYSGDEVVQFFRKTGQFKAGQRVKASEMLPELGKVKAKHFAVFQESTVDLAVGDTIRITSNGRDVTGKHRVDNGRIDKVKGFTPQGGIVLANGWEIGASFGHVTHGLVQTSPASQSKTEDIVLAAFNRASLGAMSARQAYVTISRGRERGMIFTDLKRDELLEAIGRDDKRKSATELFQTGTQAAPPAAEQRGKLQEFVAQVQETYRRLRMWAQNALPPLTQERKWSHGR